MCYLRNKCYTSQYNGIAPIKTSINKPGKADFKTSWTPLLLRRDIPFVLQTDRHIYFCKQSYKTQNTSSNSLHVSAWINHHHAHDENIKKKNWNNNQVWDLKHWQLTQGLWSHTWLLL